MSEIDLTDFDSGKLIRLAQRDDTLCRLKRSLPLAEVGFEGEAVTYSEARSSAYELRKEARDRILSS